MKTSLNLDDTLMREAMAASGLSEKTAVIHEGLRLIVEKGARERLIQLGGKIKEIRPVSRRR